MSKNKKTRIAKGLGASALAVATLASGLSFGSASASASSSGSVAASDGSFQFIVNHGSEILGVTDPGAATLSTRSFSTLPEAAAAATTYRWDMKTGHVRDAEGKLCLVNQGLEAFLGSCASPNVISLQRDSDGHIFSPRTAGGENQYLVYYLKHLHFGSSTDSAKVRFADGFGFRAFSADVTSVDIPGRSAVLSGKASPSAYVVIEWGDGQTDELRADATTGEWAYNLEGLKLGKNPVKLKQYENQQLTGEYDLDVDLKVADLTVDHKFGANRDDLVTLSGKAEPGAFVQVFDKDDKLVASSGAVSEVTGEWTLELPAPNASGAYEIAVYQSVQGERTSRQDVSIDYGRKLVVAKPNNGDAHPGGTLRMNGTGEPGSNILVHEGKELVGSTTVLQTGNWNLTTKDLNAREHRLSVTQQSKGGNTTVETVTVNPGESNTAPLVIQTPQDGSTVESGSNRVEFSGTGEPGARVQVQTQGASPRTIVNTLVRPDGTWSQLGQNLAFDVNYVLDTIYTPSGQAAINGTHRVTLKDANPGVTQPFVFSTPSNGSEVVAPDKRVRLAGSGTTGTTVSIWAHSSKARLIGTATVGKDGQWEIPAGAFNNQNTRYDLHVEYTAPGQATQSLTHSIIVKAQNGVERPFLISSPEAGSIVIAPENRVTFEGTGTTGTNVVIYNYSTKDRVVATAVVDDKGAWKTTGALNNQAGEYKLHVEYTEPGKPVESFNHQIYIKAEASTDRPFEVGTPTEGSTVVLDNNRTSIEGTGKTGGQVKVWNYKSKDRIVIEGQKVLTVDENGKWSGAGTFAAQPYELHIEYFAPGEDIDGAPTQVMTRSFTATK